MKATPVIDLFQEKFVITPGCWIWTAHKDRKGYGQFSVRRILKYAHRVSYEMYVGPIQDGMLVCHKCDNPSCVNPDHLFIGSPKENTQDMMEKRRNKAEIHRGEEHGMAKLTVDKVREIREATDSQREIAARFGVTQSHVSAIKTKRLWRNA
jgi:hypothetical protein